MAPDPLTADQIDALQTWGSGLLRDGRSEELRAAGRAITMLIDELARVQRELWHERVGVPSAIEGELPTPPAQRPRAQPETRPALATHPA